jgi:hypothetical protein
MGDLTISNHSNWGSICRDVVRGAGPSEADTKKGFSFSACNALLEAAAKAREAQSMTQEDPAREDPAKAAAKYREAADLAACPDYGLAAHYLRAAGVAGLRAQDAGDRSAANTDFENANKLDEQKQCWLGM